MSESYNSDASDWSNVSISTT
jgi:hypothetical protein